tara:strand:+ start:460 stop:684 length:225 start_codon:yes stop_codon:yes gene_type:complete
MSFIKEYSFTNQEAIEICEQLVPSENEEELAAWQYLIDTGLAWKLQGWFGRTAKRLIDEGYCTYTDRADERRQT